MTNQERVSAQVRNVADLPAPLSNAMRQGLAPHDDIDLLIYKPAEMAGMESSPPKALAIMRNAFVFAELPDGQPSRVVRGEFDNILLVELATLLLYGHLRIDFADAGRRREIAMEYNSVSHELYRRAANLILTGISPNRPAGDAREVPPPLDMTSWPITVRRAAEFVMLYDAPLYSGTWWPSVRGGFSYELAPAGVVLARGNHLTVVTLEQSGPWDRVRAVPTYGIIATYLPADRIATVEVHPTPKLVVIDVEMLGYHGGEKFHLAVPVESANAAKAVINGVLQRPRP